jgi:mRNA-degrading endonuclease RelE of RelBE toxin-antitoxin system
LASERRKTCQVDLSQSATARKSRPWVAGGARAKEFRIADTFTDSLARLTGDEQKLVKTTAFDLQLNPANPGLSFHKLDKAKDNNFWSVRVNRDIRLIVHRTRDSLMLCYVDHQDKAYDWAERRRLESIRSAAHVSVGRMHLLDVRT